MENTLIEFQIPDGTSISGYAPLTAFLETLQKFSAFYHNDSENILNISNVYFVERAIPFLKITISHTGEGHAADIPKTKIENITVQKSGNSYEYTAVVSGYLVLNADNVFDIRDPIRLSRDKVSLFFFAGYFAGAEERLSRHLESYLSDETASLRPQNIVLKPSDIILSLKKGTAVRMIIAKGTAPVRAVHDTLTFLFEQKPAAVQTGSIDYRNICRFREAKKDTALAEIIAGSDGTPGVDVFGNPVSQGIREKKTLEAGPNINTETTGDKTVFSAKVTGIIEFSGQKLDLKEDLVIEKDVGMDTGNISYSRDITVKGNVTSAFSVMCGGKLIIAGNIEKDAAVSCGGDMEISGGIFGSAGDIIVKGNMIAGFIQDARISCGGSFTVKKYVYNSDIFTTGTITVEGTDIKKKNRGSVVGGVMNSMGVMELHSAGSFTGETKLISGMHYRKYSKINDFKEKLPALSKAVILAQKKIGFSLSGKAAMLEKLKHMNEAQKKEMKEMLVYIRKLTSKIIEIKSLMEKYQTEIFAPEMDKLSVSIREFLIPDVHVQIGKAANTIKREYSKVKFRLIENVLTVDIS